MPADIVRVHDHDMRFRCEHRSACEKKYEKDENCSGFHRELHIVPCGFCLLGQFYGGIDFFAVTLDHGIQFLLNLTQQAWWIDTGEIAVDMFVHNFNQGEYLG